MRIRVLILVAALLLTVRFYSTSAQTTSTTFQNCTVVMTGSSAVITCPVTPPPPPLACTVTPALKSLQVGVPMVPIDVSAQCTGGKKPYTFSAVSFPIGIVISTAGVISGTPQTAGTFTLTWKATDSATTAQIFKRRVIFHAKNGD